MGDGFPKSAYRGGDFFGFVNATLEYGLFDEVEFAGDVELGLEFSVGAEGNVQKPSEICFAVAFVAFGNI